MRNKIVPALIVLFSLTTPFVAFADSYKVEGAGNTFVNGCYSYIGDSGDFAGVAGKPAYGLNGSTGGFSLIYTNYFELVYFIGGIYTGQGYYYDNNGSSGSYLGINTTNAFGTNPVPTLSYFASTNDCTNGGGGGGGVFQGLIDSASSGFASTSGFTMASAVGFVDENLIKLFIGSGMSVLYNLRWWIIAMLVIAGIIYFAFRAFRFFRT